MDVTYCKKCNRFYYRTRKGNYCKECNAPLISVPVSPQEFSEMSLNERYRLAYKLTNDDI